MTYAYVHCNMISSTP